VFGLSQIQQTLDLSGESFKTRHGRFKIQYLLRSPPRGWRNGLESVDGLGIIRAYARALERTYKSMMDAGWEEPDRGPARDPIPVLVHDFDHPFCGPTSLPAGAVVGLLSELDETTPNHCLKRAAIDASHETVHLFTLVHRRHMGLRDIRKWAWFDEATAVHIERRLNPRNPASLSNGYARDWVNFPEISLEFEGEQAGYHSAWFVTHLVGQYGDDFLRDVWHEAQPGETPCQVIDRLLWQRQPTTSKPVSPWSLLGTLVHDYAVRSHHTRALDALANRRYGDRKFTYVLPLDGTVELPHPWTDEIPPLGCRYYRIGPVKQPRRVSIELIPDDPHAQTALWATVHADGPGVNGCLSPTPLETYRDPTALRRVVAALDNPDHACELVLVVSHTASVAHLEDDPSAAVLKYNIRVSDA
jgi:hypothetical protein